MKVKIANRNIFALCLMFLHLQLYGEGADQKDSTDFLQLVRNYADAMITDGRDVYGRTNSPLFASSLNRKTLHLDSAIQSAKIPGVRARDRSIAGANLIDDIDLLKILYELTDISGDQKYADEANLALAYFFQNCQSESTGLMCWGEHLYWDFVQDDCGYAPNYDFHEATAWPFWDQSYALAPDACWKFAMSEWDHQIDDKTTGDFSRHARYTKHETFSGFDFPRYAGQMIERWALAYDYPGNESQPRREELLTTITVLFNRMVENAQLSPSGYLFAGRSPQGDHNQVVWLTSNLELARCLEVAAPVMDQEQGEQMLAFAFKQDTDFLHAPHKLDSLGGGFAVTLHAQTGLPRSRSMNKPYTSTWSSGYGYGTHAGVANLCFERSQRLKTDHPKEATTYQNLALQAAENYLDSDPGKNNLLKPKEFSDVIELMLNSYAQTGNEKYLQRARHFAHLGTELFLYDGSPLPKATNQHNHYESITGGPSFMLQLLKLRMALE